MFNPDQIKQQFPILERHINGHPLTYLDNAATTQKPKVVIDAISNYYTHHNANVHRGIHALGDESTQVYHKAKEQIVTFFGAKAQELILTRNTSEAANLVRFGWGRHNLKTGDIIITSELEHHSNLVVWQELARETGAGLTFVDVTENGEVDLVHLEALLGSMGQEVKLIALSLLSNTTGAVLDANKVIKLRHKHAKQALILLDAAQAAANMPIDFDNLQADFLVFSGHKLYGPMGTGGLLVKPSCLKDFKPMLVGGGMIKAVYLNGSEYQETPELFEAGTPDVAGAVGLAAAVNFLDTLGMGDVAQHSRQLTAAAYSQLSALRRVKLIGPKPSQESTKPNRLGSVAFTYQGVHAHDVAQVLDSVGVAVRSGHHCTMPFHDKFGLVATTRASFGVYNTKRDIEKLVEGLAKVDQVFGLS